MPGSLLLVFTFYLFKRFKMVTAEHGFNAATMEIFDYTFTKMTFCLLKED